MKTLEVPDQLYDALDALVSTFTAKGKDYDTAEQTLDGNFAYAQRYGLKPWEIPHLYVDGKLSRLSSLRRNGRNATNEPVVDSYRDIAVFAVMAYALLLHHNVIAHPTEAGGSAGGDSQFIGTGSPAIIAAGGGAGLPASGGPRD